MSDQYEAPDLSDVPLSDLPALMLACARSGDPSDWAFAKACRDELARRKPEQKAKRRSPPMTDIPIPRELVERINDALFRASDAQLLLELQGALLAALTQQAEVRPAKYNSGNPKLDTLPAVTHEAGAGARWNHDEVMLFMTTMEELAAATPPSPSAEPANVPHTCAGFIGAFVSMNGRQPTQQEVWDAGIRSWRDLSPAQPSGEVLTVDALAQEIRRVDGRNSLGAGALAEALMPLIQRATLAKIGARHG